MNLKVLIKYINIITHKNSNVNNFYNIFQYFLKFYLNTTIFTNLNCELNSLNIGAKVLCGHPKFSV